MGGLSQPNLVELDEGAKKSLKGFGATSIEKIPKISASGRNFLDPLPSPPSSKKGPTDENVGISYLIVIIKFSFFRVSNPSPPYFIRKPNLTDFIN